jgi:hypothetical protein
LRHQLLREQPADVAKLEHPLARRVDEIAVSVVDHDEVALGVKPRTPQLACRLLIRIAGKSLIGGIAAAGPVDERRRHGQLRLGATSDVTLRDDDFDAHEPRLAAGMEGNEMRVRAVERPLAFDDSPCERQIRVDRAPGAVARDGAQRPRPLDLDDARGGRYDG